MKHHDMEQFDPCYTESFTYHDLGNRLTAVYRDGSSEAYAHNVANEYTTIGGASISHDDAGNMTRDASDYVYAYDYENRLTKVSHSSVTIATYAYDALNRRIEKYDPCDSGETTRYYYDGWRVLSEHDAADDNQAMLRYFVYGIYIDEIAMIPYSVGVWISS